MILKKLILKDFGPVEGTISLPAGDKCFPGNGTIGITGRNGIGKTHVTAAVKYLLTGKTDKKMFTYVHGFGRKSPNKTTVTGVFEADGKEVEIKRTISISDKLNVEEIDNKLLNSEAIKTKATASVKIGKAKAVRSASEVARIVEELTGIENTTHHDVIFVDQGRAGQILYATPAELQKSLHALSGASTCQRAVEAAQAMLPQLAAVDRSEEIQDKESQIANIDSEMKELNAQIEKLTTEKNRLPDEQKARESLFALKKEEEKSEKLKEFRSDLKTKQEELAKARGEAEEYRALHEDLLSQDTEQFEKEYHDSIEYMAGLESKQKLQKQKLDTLERVDQLTREYDNRTEEYNSLREPEDNTQEIEEGLNQARQTLNNARKFLEVFGDTGKCPTCGTAVENADELIARNTNIAEEYKTRVERLEKELTDRRTALSIYNSKVQDYKVWSSTFSERLEEATNALNNLEDIEEVDPVREQKCKDFIDQYQQFQTTLKEVAAAKQNADSKVTTCESNVVAVKDRISDLTSSVSRAVEGDETELDNIVNQHVSLNSAISTHTGEQTAKQTERNRRDAELAVLKAEQEQIECKLKAKKLLEGVKTVMHRSAIPHDISSLYVIDINARLQKYCDKLKLPFTLFIHPDNLSFMAMIEDTAIPVSQLSGGQKTMAAWAWHLSLYEKHGKSFGMLFMDEPTTGVDEDNMENIAEALRYMNEYCSGAGIQLVMITHETVLIPCFSHTENLN